MHVDGFRFDLATTLARQDGGFSRLSAFFDLVAQDPVVSQAKLIAEPWDVGQMDSYAVGEFPALWREWNGRYRDSMRDFWRSQKIGLGEFATRFAGSYDLYGDDRRRPTASVNLITVHDGFTLRDLVSYDGKHNEANGEDNRPDQPRTFSGNAHHGALAHHCARRYHRAWARRMDEAIGSDTRGRDGDTQEARGHQAGAAGLVHRPGVDGRDRDAGAALPSPDAQRALRSRRAHGVAPSPVRPDPARHRGRGAGAEPGRRTGTDPGR
jgi:hypothetical protein